MKIPAAFLRKCEEMGLSLGHALELAEMWEEGCGRELSLKPSAVRMRAKREREAGRETPASQEPSQVTRHSDGAEKSASLRGLDNNPPSPSESTPKRSDRGVRLPDDWEPDLAPAAIGELTGVQALAEADKFRDYWRAVPGAKGRKTDWPATWRNWCRNAVAYHKRNPRRADDRPRTDQRATAFAGRLADIDAAMAAAVQPVAGGRRG
jgi:hypothetical protein